MRKYIEQGSCQHLARKTWSHRSEGMVWIQQSGASSGQCQGRSAQCGTAVWCVDLGYLSSGLVPASVIPLRVVYSSPQVPLISALDSLMMSVEFPQKPIYGRSHSADMAVPITYTDILSVFLPDVSSMTQVVFFLNQNVMADWQLSWLTWVTSFWFIYFVYLDQTNAI